MSKLIKKANDFWEGLNVIKKILVIMGSIITFLTAGTGGWAGMDVLEKIEMNEKYNKAQDVQIAVQQTHIKAIAKELIKSNYKFDKEVLEDDIADYKSELRGIRRRCGSKGKPECDEIEVEDYNEALADLEKAEAKLAKLEEKMELLKEERLRKIKDGK